MSKWSPCILHCECGWEKIYRNPVAAQWGGIAHLPLCLFYREAKRLIQLYDMGAKVKCWNCQKLTTIYFTYCAHCDEQIFFTDDAPVTEDMGTEESDMLPSSGATPAGTGGRKKQGGMKFLTNEMLSQQPQSAKIVAIKYDGENRFGPRVVLKLAFQGQTVFWGLDIKKNPNYQMLLEKFGQDENDYVDKEILINLEKDDFSGNWFPAISFPRTQEKKK